ncbi:sigma 54-interacting transcriptional regulator [Pseudoalteromonas sp. CST5]|uniref:sigma-54 interaction domain-containing protein n=1 Tax=unclassified Pseudoalteromonas TaxID=194690 RepID=UPI0023598F17|nr:MULTISPECIES: sigma 54-interacting transcriptional regulator [unclassified Pseudoalteromonas]MDC9515275.1 sigma 54-interacting transcriptional regulator [Pseudoalteromonas sp. CST1]MDC9539593.1 sigma 54-interacting transcriptional regulator [Pseudoalteromonas sp. CST3]MDC9541706.1 sigma 54-interacting transcriptional regulator [Pseudoalteromonas sp. CST2]MDC9547076.1 sigma 54-interacting transcriptional regulator [Pseudoalteromonas sp. CST4]MDC9551247.1 sigma 54-interacting transcriptional 
MIKQFLNDPKLLLNAVGEGIYGFDLSGNAVFVNPAAERMTGWKAQELLGKKIHQYHHHSHADGSPYPADECQIYCTMFDGKRREVKNEVFWRKDGTSFAVEYTSTPVYRQGELIGAVAVFRDISAQQQTQNELKQALEQVKHLSEQLQDENNYLIAELNEDWQDSGLVGQSHVFQAMLAQIKLVSETDSTVLILGENGTGKELVARNLHRLSKRSNQAFIKVNCAAFTPSLLESELFGHERGAFTGANERRKGRFELADKGTLFLDEVAELPLEAQSKLLRVLQEQEFERVGGSTTLKVNIRVLAATNRDLWQMVQKGTFRIDLYYRLNVFPIKVPALKERKEDIPYLCTNLITQLNKRLAKQIKGVSKKAISQLQAYDWPGNIRELQNVLEREAILTKHTVLKLSQPLHGDASTAVHTSLTLAQAQKQHIIAVLELSQWQISGDKGAACKLGLPESTLRSKMRKLGISKNT